MDNILEMLKGKKTYITVVLLSIANALYIFGLVEADTIYKINGVLMSFGLGFLRAGIPPKN